MLSGKHMPIHRPQDETLFCGRGVTASRGHVTFDWGPVSAARPHNDMWVRAAGSRHQEQFRLPGLTNGFNHRLITKRT